MIIAYGVLESIVPKYSYRSGKMDKRILDYLDSRRLQGGFSVEAPKRHSGPFSGRFGSDSGGLPGCNSDFWPVTPTFGLYL